MIEITIVSYRLAYLRITSHFYVIFTFLYLLFFRFLILILQIITPLLAIIIINVPEPIGYMKYLFLKMLFFVDFLYFC